MKDFLHGRSAASNPAQRKSSQLPPSSLPALSSLQDVSITQDMPLEDNLPAESFSEPPPPQEPVQLPEPQLELVHDAQGRIGHIIVTCRCGEKIILQCNY